MFKLVSLLLVAIPVFLFLRAVLGRSTAMKRAASDFRRRVDYLVWAILVVIAVGLVYSVVSYMSLWLHAPSPGVNKSGAFLSVPVGHLAMAGAEAVE